MRPAASSPIDSYHTYAAQDYMSPMTNDECAPPPRPTITANQPPAAARKLQRVPRCLSALGHLCRRRPPGAGAEIPESRLKETAYPGPTAIRCTSGISGDMASQAPKRETDLNIQWSDIPQTSSNRSRRLMVRPVEDKSTSQTPCKTGQKLYEEQK